MCPMPTPSKANTIITAIIAGLLVLLLWNAGDADIFGLVIPVWMVAVVTFSVGRAVGFVR